MASGPPNLGTNRFAILSDSPAKKRRSNKNITPDLFPTLPTIHATDPKFVILSSVNNDKSLAQFSCFAIHKALLLISKDILSVSELRDGNLLLLLKNLTVANKFINCKSLQGVCEIVAKLHENLNITKGTVFAPFLNSIPEDEIVEELKEFGVVNAYKFQKNIDGKQQPSGVVLLSFNRYNPPTSINIAWRKVTVRQYFPNPMRCKSCQLLGHTSKFCKRSPSCVHCNLPPHSPNECSRSFCANCYGTHSASSPECPKFQQSKEIIKIKTIDKCSVKDAIKKYKQLNPTTPQIYSSYSAAIASSLPKTNTISSNTQQAIPNQTLTKSITNTHISNSLSTLSDHTPSIQHSNTKIVINKNAHLSSNLNKPPVNDSCSHESPSHSFLNDTNLYNPLPTLNKVLSSSQLSLANSDDMSLSN